MAEPRTIAPIVSSRWLADNSHDPKLVIVDCRSVEEYQAGHIPGAVNVPFTSWAITKNGLLVELPDVGDLFQTIGAAGIKSDSKVVVVNKTDSLNDLADATRIACTLFYAGVKNVAILDGGHNNWLKEAKPLSKEDARPTPAAYKSKPNKAFFVTKEYVQKKLGKSTIVDARDPGDFFGATQDPYSARPGHIPGASSLPTLWVWTKDGTYKSLEELREMALGVVGEDKSQEVIAYCGVGGYASTWCFVLRELLGYKDVKIYDGAAQEWTSDPEAPVVKYRWH